MLSTVVVSFLERKILSHSCAIVLFWTAKHHAWSSTKVHMNNRTSWIYCSFTVGEACSFIFETAETYCVYDSLWNFQRSYCKSEHIFNLKGILICSMFAGNPRGCQLAYCHGAKLNCTTWDHANNNLKPFHQASTNDWSEASCSRCITREEAW